MAKKPEYKNNNLNIPPVTRSQHINREKDDVQDITVGLIDIDNAIKYYFDNVIQPTVIENDSQVKVPVIMGSPERWKSVQKDGFYRDTSGLLTCPLIMFRRTGMEKKRTITRNLDANNPNLFQSFERKYSPRNNYDQFSLLTNTRPQREIHNVVVPDYMQINYECIIWTDYLVQMNKVQEAINYAESSYWGEKDKFNFYAVINSFSNATEVTDGTERVVKVTFDLTIHGYIIPNTVQKDITQYNKRAFSFSRIKFGTAVVESFDEEDNPTGPIYSGEVRQLVQTDIDMAQIDPAVLAYLRANKTSVTELINSSTNTATFTNTTILEAPLSLPATTVYDFSFFINGQYIPYTAVTLWEQQGTDVILTFDESVLGFTIKDGDVPSAVGKFA